MKIFLQLHFLVSATILTIICIAIFHTIQKLIRKRFSHELLKENHEVGGFIYNAVGIIYAVLIAFVVFAIWTGQQDTNTKIEMEASDLLDL
jgi:small-conductance mechanosensitive channel